MNTVRPITGLGTSISKGYYAIIMADSDKWPWEYAVFVSKLLRNVEFPTPELIHDMKAEELAKFELKLIYK